jgi:glycosyltransferase involved in cell wall biosynthesis
VSRVIFTLPAFSRPTGGIWVLTRFARLLRGACVDAVLMTDQGELLKRFYGDVEVPVVSTVVPSARDLVVRSEMNTPASMRQASAAGVRQVLIVQNHHYVGESLEDGQRYADLGIERVAGVSETIARALIERRAADAVSVVPPPIERWIAGGEEPAGERASAIAVMPRKLPKTFEAIRRGFRRRYPALSHMPFAILEDASHRTVLRHLARSSVFLSLQHREGFGLPALEAMAAGCLVAGFAGGAEYASPDNGFWAADGDVEAAIDALARAVTASLGKDADETGRMTAARVRAAAANTLDRYGEARTRDTLLAFIRGDVRAA